MSISLIHRLFWLQAEFSEINLASYSDTGTMVDIKVTRNGTRVVRYGHTKLLIFYVRIFLKGGSLPEKMLYFKKSLVYIVLKIS